MRIGVSSTDFSSYRFDDVLPQVAKFFDHWEIFSEAEHHLQEVSGVFSMMKGSYDLTYSVHSPISDTNLAALTERMREASVLEVLSLMEECINLDIDTITIHPGIYSLSVPGMQEKSVAAAKKSIRGLDRMVSQYGVRLCLENMPSFPMMLGRTADEMAELLDGTDMKVCFDIGHANTTGQIDEIIDRLGDRIIHMHVHDNDGTSDQHLTVGDGSIDFAAHLGKLSGYRGLHIIESKSLESAVDSKSALEALGL